MTGWLILASLMLATGAALVLLRLPRLLASMAGAAIMLGAAGYAWQGRPDLPGRPVDAARSASEVDPGLIDLRTAMFGRFGTDGAYLVAADAMARSGSPEYEVQAILGGIRQSPRSVALWTALGDALVRHDGGHLSAPAQFAFDRARRLGPGEPGPLFFMGLAQVRSNDFARAEASWRRALALTPANAPYREAIAERLVLLARLRAAMDRAGPPAQPAR